MPSYHINTIMNSEKTTKDSNCKGMNGVGSSVIVLPSKNPKESKTENSKYSTGSQQPSASMWKAALLGFTENTTLHGVRFIFMENVFVMRRAVWLILFSLCSVLMMVQIVERIVFFYNFPMTVNVQVNYNKTLAFPAITICNQNAFRATSAADKNLYDLLEAMHDSELSIINSSVLLRYGAGNLTLEYLYLATKHLKEDLIQSCEWQDSLCGPSDFREILTDHGVCFTFNHDINNPLWATSAGSDYGLRLTLNVEQYEYMPGPHNAAGVKILLHDQNEFPKVAELGLAIPTGSHTFVGIQMCTIKNLPEPHGSCRSMESPYYGKYTPDACQMACMSILMQKMCKCRHFFLPHVNDNPPVCTLEQYYDCYVNRIDEVKAQVRVNCDCPVPCNFVVYDPTISFATTSSYATDGILGKTSRKELRRKYHRAMETTSRVDHKLFETFKTLERDMRLKFASVHDVLTIDVKRKIEYQKTKLVSLYDELQTIYQNKSYLLNWQEFHVKKNFVRARNAMEERTLSVVAHSYQEFAYQMEGRLAQLAAKNGSKALYSEDVRTGVYLNLRTSIGGRMDLSDRALQNYTQLYTAYETGSPIFRYKYKTESFSENPHITPRPLLNASLWHNELAVRLCGRLGDDVLQYKEALWKYLDIAKIVYENGSFDKDLAEKNHEVNVLFLVSGRRFYHAKSVFYSECIDYPTAFLLNKHADLDRQWRYFKDRFDSLYNKLVSLLFDIEVMRTSTLETLQRIVNLGHNFTKNRNVTKLEIAKDIISEHTLESISDLKNFMSKIRLRGQNIYDEWAPTIEESKEVWGFVLGDENLEEFYKHKNMSEYLRDFKDVAKELTEKYILIRENCDFRHLLESQDSLFLDSLQKVIGHMNAFHEKSQLDTNFIKNNFLQLDVFYREKSYEEITQQRAYDMFALLCDIGGSMGLFVGASFLTLYEILDFGVHQCLFSFIKRCTS